MQYLKPVRLAQRHLRFSVGSHRKTLHNVPIMQTTMELMIVRPVILQRKCGIKFNGYILKLCLNMLIIFEVPQHTDKTNTATIRCCDFAKRGFVIGGKLSYHSYLGNSLDRPRGFKLLASSNMCINHSQRGCHYKSFFYENTLGNIVI